MSEATSFAEPGDTSWDLSGRKRLHDNALGLGLVDCQTECEENCQSNHCATGRCASAGRGITCGISFGVGANTLVIDSQADEGTRSPLRSASMISRWALMLLCACGASSIDPWKVPGWE